MKSPVFSDILSEIDQELECECNGIFLYLGFRTHIIMEQLKHELIPGLISSFLSGTQKQHARYLILYLPEEQSFSAEEYLMRIFTELQHPEAGSHIMKLLLLIRFFNFLGKNSRDKTETVSNREHGTLLFDKIVYYVNEQPPLLPHFSEGNRDDADGIPKDRVKIHPV